MISGKLTFKIYLLVLETTSFDFKGLTKHCHAQGVGWCRMVRETTGASLCAVLFLVTVWQLVRRILVSKSKTKIVIKNSLNFFVHI